MKMGGLCLSEDAFRHSSCCVRFSVVLLSRMCYGSLGSCRLSRWICIIGTQANTLIPCCVDHVLVVILISCCAQITASEFAETEQSQNG